MSIEIILNGYLIGRIALHFHTHIIICHRNISIATLVLAKRPIPSRDGMTRE